MPRLADCLALARAVDPARASALSADFDGLDAETHALAVLLGTAFLALTPRLGWQFDALAGLARRGLARPPRRAELIFELGLAPDEPPLDSPRHALVRGLRRYVWAEKARIALRELAPVRLGGAPISVTMRELSQLATVVFDRALSEALADAEGRFGVPRQRSGACVGLAVLGLGKLGGGELNAGSDVDVMFVYDTDEGESRVSLQEHFTLVVQRTVRTIEAPTEDGTAWRVDLRLRPEGARGALVNSLEAAERYYETWGRLWERATLIRCRPIAGAVETGNRFVEEIARPFVYRQEIDPTVAPRLFELARRARHELSPDPDRDLKLGRGGIREIEFFVQALQLIWGGRERSLRVPGCLEALTRLAAGGLVTGGEARTLERAYLELRRIEHRIQFMTGLQTHLVPNEEAELAPLARSLGHVDGASLTQALAETRARVTAVVDTLASGGAPIRSERLAVAWFLDGSASRESQHEGVFSDPEMLEHLEALGRRPDSLLGLLSRERYPRLLEEVLGAVEDAPDPRQALCYLRAFFARFYSPGPYVEVLAQDRQALRRFARELGSSLVVAEAIVDQPELAELILFAAPAPDTILRTVREQLAKAKRDFASDAPQGAASSARVPPEDRREGLVAALRRARHRAVVTIAMLDLADLIETREVTALLSQLADEILDHAVAHELGRENRGLAVIAVGKFGGRELGYGSDLDVFFVFDPACAPPGTEPDEHFARVAQRVIRLISEAHPAGPGYDLDVRLRPSGSHGFLVTSEAAFAAYHGLASTDSGAVPEGGTVSLGAAWERQVLIRARAVAGDRELGARVIRLAGKAAYEGGAPDAPALHHLRCRMQAELAKERVSKKDVKLGRGGLLDVEFLTQWLQMRHGADPRVRGADTERALEALTQAGYLSTNAFETLRQSYAFLRRLEQRLAVLHGKGSSVIDFERPGIAELGRRLGFHDSLEADAATRLRERYLSVTNAVRATYLGVLGLPPES